MAISVVQPGEDNLTWPIGLFAEHMNKYFFPMYKSTSMY